jgi:hypothetical protein
MKKISIYHILLLATMMAPIFKVEAQWLTTGNALGGAGLLGSTNNNSYSLISNNTQRIRITSDGNIQLGSNAVLNTSPANYARFDEDGDLRFFGTGSYLVPSNAYAFRWEGDEDVGLFFNALLSRYEFRNNAGQSAVHISSSGDMNVSGNIDLAGDVLIGTDKSIRMGNSGSMEARLYIEDGVDATLASGGFVVLGTQDYTNLALDQNEIMARYGQDPTTLYLQREGGDVHIGGTVPNLIVKSSGQVGIRTATPSRELELVHPSGSGSLYGLMIANEEVNNQDWTLYTNNADGDLAFYQNGVFAGEFSDFDGIYTPSDARLKTNITDMEPILARFMELEPKTFTYIKSEHPDKIHIGFIAQEMEKQFPEIVGRAEEDQETYVMNYSLLSVLAVKAIQEQQEILDDQKNDIDVLKDEMKALKISLGQAGTTNHSPENNSSIDKESMLYQNQPNPFSDKTTY